MRWWVAVVVVVVRVQGERQNVERSHSVDMRSHALARQGLDHFAPARRSFQASQTEHFRAPAHPTRLANYLKFARFRLDNQ